MCIRDTGDTVFSPSEGSGSRMFVGEIWGGILLASRTHPTNEAQDQELTAPSITITAVVLAN